MLNKKIYLTSVILLLQGTLQGCSPSEFASVNLTAALPDATNSKIEVKGTSVADGITQTTVEVVLRDKNNNPIPGMTPDLQATGTNNVMIPCGKTNANGFTTCKILSTSPELKRLSLVGVPGPWAEANFLPPPPSLTLFAIVSSGDLQTLPSGRKILATSGIVESSIDLRDNSNVLRARTSHMGTIIDPE